MSCYSLLQHSRPAWLELFVDHTHTYTFNEQSKIATALTPQADGEPETVVSTSLQKIKSIKNLPKQKTKKPFFFSIFYFIKSETIDSFVNHFDGHFAYLKTLDFSFNVLAQMLG